MLYMYTRQYTAESEMRRSFAKALVSQRHNGPKNGVPSSLVASFRRTARCVALRKLHNIGIVVAVQWPKCLFLNRSMASEAVRVKSTEV